MSHVSSHMICHITDFKLKIEKHVIEHEFKIKEETEGERDKEADKTKKRQAVIQI